MLNNNLVLSFLISALSTLFIHISKNDEHINMPINKNDIVKNFGIIFIVSNILLFLKKNKMSGGGVTNFKMPSGENLLTHSSRPPF